MKNLGERHHSELVTLLCLLVAMHPTGTLLPVTGADPSISYSNISTIDARRTSPHSLQRHESYSCICSTNKIIILCQTAQLNCSSLKLIPGIHDASYRRERDILHPLSYTAQKDPPPPWPTTLTNCFCRHLCLTFTGHNTVLD
jgi:hypothetical protein